MELVRVTKPEQIASILKIEDNTFGHTSMPMGKGEWVQWLMSLRDKEDFLAVWAFVEEGQVVAYTVSVNAFYPPISNAVLSLYTYCPFGFRKTAELLAKVKQWCNSFGIYRLICQTPYPDLAEKHGFKKDKNTLMYMDFKEDEE